MFALTVSPISFARPWRAVLEVGVAPEPATPEAIAVAFVRVLRGSGIEVPVGATLLFVQALGYLGLASRSEVYWAGRSTLVRRCEDIAVFDRAFAVFWDRREAGPEEVELPPEEVVIALDIPDADGSAAGDDDEVIVDAPVVTLRWSAREILRHRDFAQYTAAEFAEARRLMSDLRLVGTTRPSRRRKQSHARRGVPDLRRTVRRSMHAGGEPVERAFLTTGERTRRVVLLLDVSGSMEPYARAFVRFLHAAVVSRSRVEAFALGTRLHARHSGTCLARSRRRDPRRGEQRRRLVGGDPPR